MNETSSSVPTAASSSSQTFSRSNLFSAFLTLQLCQLTQPYGSLLFRGVSGWLWRCNPIASFVEACIIAWQLIKSLFQAYEDVRRSRATSAEPTPWKKQLYATAAALLLLRSFTDNESDDGLMEKLLTGTFLDGGKEESVVPAQMDANQPDEITATTMTTTVNSQSAPLQSLEAVSEEGAPAPWTGGIHHPPQNGPVAVLQQEVLRRRTSELEAGPTPPHPVHSLVAANPNSEKSQLLNSAFGSNALAHRELRIDLVTTASVGLIFVKVLFIKGVPWYTAAASFTILGWFSVQLLLLIFHIQEMDELDMATSIRSARTIDTDLRENSALWDAIYYCLHLPMVGYLSYFLTFRLYSVLPGWIQSDADSFLNMIALLTGVLTAYSAAIYFLKSVFICITKGVHGVLQFFMSPLLLWISLGSLTYSFKESFEMYGIYKPFFTNPVLDVMVDTVFRKVVTTAWFLTILGPVSLGLFFILLCQFDPGVEGKKNLRRRISLGNAIMTVVVFACYLVTYEPQGTWQPAWIDWLG